jgi:hypothetical protein
MKLRNLSNIIEKSDICLILNAHSTTLLNKTPTESTKTLIFKELGFFGAESFEDFKEELNAERIIEIHDRIREKWIREKARTTSLPIS